MIVRWNLLLAWLGIPGVILGALVVNRLGTLCRVQASPDLA